MLRPARGWEGSVGVAPPSARVVPEGSPRRARVRAGRRGPVSPNRRSLPALPSPDPPQSHAARWGPRDPLSAGTAEPERLSAAQSRSSVLEQVLHGRDDADPLALRREGVPVLDAE